MSEAFRLAIESDKLAAALAAVGGAVPSKGVMPVMQNALITTTSVGATVHAADGEVSCRAVVSDASADDGAVLAPHSRLSAILREHKGEVRLEAEGNKLTVTTAAATYELPTEDVGNWPATEPPEGEPTLAVDAEALASALARTTFAAAKDEGKYAMRGVLWDVKGRALKLVATDGKRLAVADVTCEGEAEVSCLLPPKAMHLLTRLCDSGPVRCWLPKGGGLAHFVTEAGSVSTRLVEGRFPPYRDVIPKPKDVAARVPIDVPAFHAAVRQAAIMTDDESKRIDFHFETGRVELRAQGATTGRAAVTYQLPAATIPGMRISFDPAYLCEYLKVAPAGDITLELVGPDKSAVFRHEGGLYLVVPLV